MAATFTSTMCAAETRDRRTLRGGVALGRRAGRDQSIHARRARSALSRGGGRIVDIPNGVRLASYEARVPAPAGWDLQPHSYAMFMGRLKYRKGVDVLLQALARTPATGKVQLVIAGDGEERAALEVLSDQLDLRVRVRSLGTVTGSAKSYLLQNARFGVIPSRQWEAFGLVVLESYASGLPIIATEMPGLADLIEPEKTGLLVRPESPDHLASAMQRLFADDWLVQRIGTARSAGGAPLRLAATRPPPSGPLRKFARHRRVAAA